MLRTAAMLADASLLHSLAIGLVIAGLIILAFTFRSVFIQGLRRISPGATPSTPAADLDAPASPARVNAAMQDAEELSQLIAERLDRHAARLEQLIAAADDRLARLEQAAAGMHSQIEARPAPAATSRRDMTDPLSRQIYDLSDQGLPPVEIARQLDQHTGKVELILALRQR